MSKLSPFLKEIVKYVKVYGLFVKNCIIAEMEFRTNFFMGVAVECSWLVSKLIYAFVFYNTGATVSGYSPDAILIFIGMHTVMTGVLISFFWPNFSRLTQYVREGTLDLFITKPISLQFMVTLRYFNFGTLLPNVVGGAAMIAVGLYRLDMPPSLYDFGAFILFVALATIVTYALFLLPNLLSFKIVDMGPINQIIGQAQEVNNVPMIVYSKWVQLAGLYLLPIFTISNAFPLFILGRMDSAFLVWIIASPIILLILIRLLWRSSIAQYASASS